MSEFLALVERHELTENRISKLTGVSERTVRRWLGEDAIPEPALRLLKLLLGEARPEEYTD